MKTVPRVMLVGYLLILAYFAFRPFALVPGFMNAPADDVREGSAMEDRKGSAMLRRSLVKAGQMSVEVLLQTASLKQGGPARIILFSRGSMCRNFMLGQSGDGLSFRLRTTETDPNGMYPSLLVPNIFDDQVLQHLTIVYDGETLRLYVDGMLRPENIGLSGDFSNWGRNHLLTIGDEASGGCPWSGTIARFSIYSRALSFEEVESLHKGSLAPGAVYVFRESESGGQGMRPLKYRNLFIFSDSQFSRVDCMANIVGFMPLAILVWLVFPAHLRRRRFTSVVLLPAVVGLAISGSIELTQRGILGRVPCLLDVVYNVLGTLLGCGLLWFGLAGQRER